MRIHCGAAARRACELDACSLSKSGLQMGTDEKMWIRSSPSIELQSRKQSPTGSDRWKAQAMELVDLKRQPRAVAALRATRL
jgi:hypothetical protein